MSICSSQLLSESRTEGRPAASTGRAQKTAAGHARDASHATRPPRQGDGTWATWSEACVASGECCQPSARWVDAGGHWVVCCVRYAGSKALQTAGTWPICFRSLIVWNVIEYFHVLSYYQCYCIWRSTGKKTSKHWFLVRRYYEPVIKIKEIWFTIVIFEKALICNTFQIANVSLGVL